MSDMLSTQLDRVTCVMDIMDMPEDADRYIIYYNEDGLNHYVFSEETFSLALNYAIWNSTEERKLAIAEVKKQWD